MKKPDGFGTMFPYVFVERANDYLKFLEKAFGAKELGRTRSPAGNIANARVKIGDTTFMVSEANEQFPASISSFYIYVVDAKAATEKAIKAGAQLLFEPCDMPYGDRQSGVKDANNNIWWLSQRLVDEPYDK